MAEQVGWLLLAFAIIFAINLVPAFMPSSWMVMAFFYIQFDLPLLPLTLIGALVSGLGRIFLAKASTFIKRRFMRGKEEDLDELGAFLNERAHFVGPTVFLYALTPLPTNNLFVAAGLAEVNLVYVLAGFWTARAIADTFFVWTTDRVFTSLGEVFEGALGNWVAVTLQVGALTSIVLMYKLPWARWLRRLDPAAPDGSGVSADGTRQRARLNRAPG